MKFCVSEIHTWVLFLTLVTRWTHTAAAAAKSLQSCLTLCDPTDGSPPGSPVPGILQARTLEWAAISFSNAWKWKVKVKLLSRVRLCVTPWTAAHHAPPSMGFSRQEYWSGVTLGNFKNLWCLGSNPELLPGFVPYMAWTSGFMKASRWHPRQKFRAWLEGSAMVKLKHSWRSQSD